MTEVRLAHDNVGFAILRDGGALLGRLTSEDTPTTRRVQVLRAFADLQPKETSMQH